MCCLLPKADAVGVMLMCVVGTEQVVEPRKLLVLGASFLKNLHFGFPFL